MIEMTLKNPEPETPEPTPETEPQENPYDKLVEELRGMLNLPEKWAKLCAFALTHLQGLYGLWLSTVMAGETLDDRIKIGLEFLPSAMVQKNLIDEAAKQRDIALAEAQEKQRKYNSGLAVPPGTVLRGGPPPSNRGKRGKRH